MRIDLRRLKRIERALAPESTIPMRHVLAALPPLSAQAAQRFDAWQRAMMAEHASNAADAPDMVARVQGWTSDDLAEYVLREVPSDMVISAESCAGLLVEAHFRWDVERYGELHAWSHLRNREEIAQRLAPRFAI
jgi:hypothetical protein